ncbi:MAG: hypothetical protein R3186_08940 [Ruegeria sp.]|nr:hypothetical protein [Ruegeria sp.]
MLLILTYSLYRSRWLDTLLTGDLTAPPLGVPVGIVTTSISSVFVFLLLFRLARANR